MVKYLVLNHFHHYNRFIPQIIPAAKIMIFNTGPITGMFGNGCPNTAAIIAIAKIISAMFAS